MKLPSKVTPFKESVIAKFVPILDKLRSESLSPSELYKTVKTKVNGPSDFMEILDCLFILEKIELNEHEEVIHYVKNGKE
ncbi:hypothetical protein NHG32_06255 [Aerococcaceae bacterium NML191219]|nr:hypothetical protein [Aerococcaceae bacterium NML191219]